MKKILFKIIILSCFFSFIGTSLFAQAQFNDLNRGAKVYIEAEDKGVIQHVKDKILLWGYWKAVDSKKEADFTLSFDVNFSLFYTINAQAISQDRKIIKKFNPKNSFKGLDPNPKRGAVKALFDKEIIPFVHGLQ